MIRIFTDGSYKSSTNKGGYASIITENDKIIKILNYGYINTTNNRMELLGVLNALLYFKHPTNLEIYSDSSYIVNSINNGYVYQWLFENDNTKKNMDLWIKIVEQLNIHNVKFFWVKGHNNHEFNELADLYANISAIVINPETDGNY